MWHASGEDKYIQSFGGRNYMHGTILKTFARSIILKYILKNRWGG
jgi:hypothetical protein